ncbi:MAG TPA: adventurous gliding motility protein GltG [Myxococcales bacterium]|nr:adventurous gliding motility protein GltG [Myxococcales bacterium]
MAVPLTLKVYKGEELIASKDYDRDLIKIGRLSSAHLCLEDEKVSRIHAVIDVGQDGAMFVTDMGSVEGTYVNGKRVTKSPLTFGDEIKVGNTTIQVHETAQNLAQAAQEGELPPPEEQMSAVDPAEALGQAAGRPATPPPAPPQAAAAPAPVPTPARTRAAAPPPPPPPQEEPPAPADESFARTEQNEVVSRGADTGQAPAAQVRQRPARRQGSGPLGLELRFSWGDFRVAEHFLPPGEPSAFTVGTAQGCHFAMGDGKLGGPRFDVAKVEKDGFSVRFTKKMKGELTRGAEAYELLHLIEGGKASSDGEAYSIHLGEDDYLWVDLGGITMEAFLQPVPRRVLVPISESMDFTVLNIFLVLFFLGALFVITSMNRETEGDEYADELSGSEARIAKLIIKPPEVQKNPLLEKLAQQKEKQSGEMSAKHSGSEGEAGRKDAPKRNAHMAPQGKPNEKDQARMLTNRIFGGKGGGLSTVFGSNGLGGELTAAMGGLFGASAGDSKGFGGLGLRGTGGGGGGVGDTIGIGAIGTKGRGGGTGTYGNGVGVLGGKKVSDIGITSSDPEVMGSLDKELIRQVIRSHRDQIRYCYETQLARFPNLKGKVAVKFVISAMGSVASSQVAQSTTSNAELEMCVAGRVRTWVFPKPKGGGVVVVTYPFLFQQAGQ